MDPTEPVPVMPLAYHEGGTAHPWRPVARLMAAAVVVQGAALATSMAFSNGLFIWASYRSYGRGGLPVYLAHLLMAVVGLALVAAGLLARRFRPVGRTCIVVLEPALLGLWVVQTGLLAWAFSRPPYGGSSFPAVLASSALGGVSSLVLPTTTWIFFARREVADVFADR